MNVMLASTSTLFGGKYLEYIKDEIRLLYSGVEEILFIPYARPGGISHEAYTETAKAFFAQFSVQVRGLHEYADPAQAVAEAKGYFTGGGNTFLLVKTLHENDLMLSLKENIEKGKPYLGTSAGANIGGVNMRTTNDMPIVYPPSFETMKLIPFNINPHYLDPDPTLHHNGETRETRIKEFLTQNNITVIGLREGNWIRRRGDQMTVEGSQKTRIFEKDKDPYELEPGADLNRLPVADY